MLAIIAVTLLAFSPARHGQARSAPTVAPKPATVTPTARGRVQASYAALPLSFEANQGQTDSQVKYMARGDGYTLFLTANDAVFSLQSRSSQKAKSSQRTQKDSNAVVHMQLQGGNSLAKVSASSQLPGKSNYFLGNDPSKWHADVPHFARVAYQDVYPGVNLAFHGAQRQTEFDFVVAPGANPAPIGFHFTGALGIKTDDSGNLIISSAAGNVQLHKPVAYQEQNGARQLVDASFILKADNQVAFELGNYDRSRELVIDPSVGYAYSTYLGGSGADEGQGIAFDGTGAAYVTGQTASANFPGATNTLAGSNDVFVTKIAADGSSLVYSTYIGGKLSDSGNGIAVDASFNAFVTGSTASTDFPTTAGVVQGSLKGTKGNAFVCELGSSGAITYCTYLGGTGKDTALGIALASDGSVYIAGGTSSTDFPTKNPLQGYIAGSTNSGFVTRLNSSGTALVFSTYLGGSANGDQAGALAVDSADNVYVAGQTFNSTFHTTTGAFQTTCGSCNTGSSGFVTVINSITPAYVYSTFLGGSTSEAADGIAVDSTGNAYVTGMTQSSNFPTTAGVLQTTYKGAGDGFVTKLNPTGTALVYSTFLGGSTFDTGASIAVDGSGNAYVTGETNSANFPTMNPTEPAANGGASTGSTDAFVSEINSTGSALVFSTYLGGSADEDSNGNLGAIAVDGTGASIYVTGKTASTDFPTQAPYPYAKGNANGGGSSDAFVVKYSQSSAAPTFSLSATALTPATVAPGGSATSTVTVTATNNFTGTVTLTCAVTGPAGAIHLPTCAAASAAGGASTTLTVNTTAAVALLERPASRHSAGMFYAMFLPIGGIALLGFGSAGSQRKKVFGFLLVGLVLSSLLLMPACGGSSNNNNGGGSPGTTAGAYTITVNGTASGATQTGTAPALTLTVN